MQVKTIKRYQDIPEESIVQEVVESDNWFRGFWISGCKITEVDVPKEYCVEI